MNRLENGSSFASRALGVVRRAPILALPIAAITGITCDTSEEISQSLTLPPSQGVSIEAGSIENCPDDVYVGKGGPAADGNAANTVVIRNKGVVFDNRVVAVLEKYEVCIDKGRVVENLNGTVAVPFILKPEDRDQALNELQPFIEEGKIEDAFLTSSLSSK